MPASKNLNVRIYSLNNFEKNKFSIFGEFTVLRMYNDLADCSRPESMLGFELITKVWHEAEGRHGTHFPIKLVENANLHGNQLLQRNFGEFWSLRLYRNKGSNQHPFLKNEPKA